MYLHRITMRPEGLSSPAFWSQIRDVYAVHQLVWSWFAEPHRTARDFVYRLEGQGHLPMLYALGAAAPKVNPEVWTVQSKEFAPKLQAGDQLGFVLRANPTRRKSKGEGAGKRHDVVMQRKLDLRAAGDALPSEAELVQAACSEWFVGKGERNGFSADTEAVIATGYRTHRVFRKGASPIRFSTVDLSGVLRVTDPERFGECLTSGLGPAKGFGCGLMLVRRI